MTLINSVFAMRIREHQMALITSEYVPFTGHTKQRRRWQQA